MKFLTANAAFIFAFVSCVTVASSHAASAVDAASAAGAATDVTDTRDTPAGSVTAIDLNRGEIAWQVPHGDGPRDHPAIRHLDLPPLGNSSHSFLSSGGPLVTGSLVFFNQVKREFDSPAFSRTEFFLRAFDKGTGELVWEHLMDEPPHGTPMTYLHQGRQYLVVATGGAGDPAYLIAYALPES